MMKVVKILKRRCAVCGKELKIKVYEDGSYRGGHYFGKVPINWKDVKTIGKTRIGKIDVNVVELVEPECEEYWECEDCYKK